MRQVWESARWERRSAEPAAQALVTEELPRAIRRIAARALDGAEGDGVAPYRQVERLMRLALTLSARGTSGRPTSRSTTSGASPGPCPRCSRSS